VAELNVQNQQMIEWPKKLVVAKAYLDQLERSNGLPAGEIATLRQAIEKAEASKLAKKDRAKLKALAMTLNKGMGMSRGGGDSAKLHDLADVLKAPVL
jgi:hypothetical protein